MNTGLFEVYNNNKHRLKFPYFYLDHTGVVDWLLEIGEREGIGSGAEQTQIVFVQNCDLNYVLAKGEAILKDWLSENKGGY